MYSSKKITGTLGTDEFNDVVNAINSLFHRYIDIDGIFYIGAAVEDIVWTE